MRLATLTLLAACRAVCGLQKAQRPQKTLIGLLDARAMVLNLVNATAEETHEESTLAENVYSAAARAGPPIRKPLSAVNAAPTRPRAPADAMPLVDDPRFKVWLSLVRNVSDPLHASDLTYAIHAMH